VATDVVRLPAIVAGEELNDASTEVRSPWTNEVVGLVPWLGADAARSAVDGAAAAMREPLPAHERAAILDRVVIELSERREEFAQLMTSENGKPVKQALIEVDRCIQTLTFSAVEARTLAGRGIALDAHPAGVGHFGFTIRVPIGVVGAITPFNFPLTLTAHKVGPAIAAGCGVVLKPAAKTPLVATELVRVFHRQGLPPQMLSVLVGPAAEISQVLIEDDRVGLITFTGSSEVGWKLREMAPRKRVTLELGNSTPMIVCADADLRAAATAAAASGFAFSGQSCISVQRVIVDRDVHDDFVAFLAEAARQQKVGDPADPQVDCGPSINREARDRVADWIEQATSGGATVVEGGTFAGDHIGPTVLDDVDPAASVWMEEAFGPVISVRASKGLDEAIDLANGTSFGLQAGVFTHDISAALDAMLRLEFGGVTINQAPQFRVDQMPYGGTKSSGNTKEGPHNAIREMTEERMVVFRH